jgi:predicted cobalt transporter CbtA
MQKKKIWETRTFWAALGAGVSTILSNFGVAPEITQTVAAILGVLTVWFVRDGIEQSKPESPEGQ